MFYLLVIFLLVAFIVRWALHSHRSAKNRSVFPEQNISDNNEIPERDYNVHVRYSAEYHATKFIWSLEDFSVILDTDYYVSYYDRLNHKLALSISLNNAENAVAVAQVCRLISLSYLIEKGEQIDSCSIQQKAYGLSVKYLKDNLEEQQAMASIRFLEELMEHDQFGRMVVKGKIYYLWSGGIIEK